MAQHQAQRWDIVLLTLKLRYYIELVTFTPNMMNPCFQMWQPYLKRHVWN